MKTQAAVVVEPGKPIEIEELTLDKPRAGEVLIQYTYAGLCHSDVHVAHGDLEARLPMVLGHEGAGIIQEVGEGVTRVKVGDHVVCSFIPNCGTCRYCATGQQSICDMGATILEGYLPGERFPITGPRGDYGAMCMLGTFSQYGVIHQNSVRQGRRRPAAGQGRARRLRRPDRLGCGGQQRRGHGRRHRRGGRHRRHRHQRRAGCAPGRREEHHRGRPPGEQAREGHGARRHAHLRQHRRGHGDAHQPDPRPDGRLGHPHPGPDDLRDRRRRLQRRGQGRRRRADRPEQADGAEHRAPRLDPDPVPQDHQGQPVRRLQPHGRHPEDPRALPER